MKIKDARSLSPTAQEALRQRAVNAVLQGKKRNEVAKIFGVSQTALRKWINLYQQGGYRALKAKKQGRPSRISLKPLQAALTVRLIIGRQPDQLKLPFALWTRDAVAQLIEQKFGIRLSRWTVGRYLKRWGFTPQKPIRRAVEQDPEAVRQWLETEYPTIMKQAKHERAEIHWGDEMGVRSEHQAGRTYGRKGKTPVIPRTGKRFGCNMISTITNRGTLRFMVFRKQFNADVFLIFLRRLIKSAGRKVYLIVDRYSVHRAGKVKKWLEKHKEQMEIFYLPAYSPELNPDEMLNNDVKTNAVRRKRAEDADELVGNVRNYLRKRQKRPAVVIKYFHAKTVMYAATSNANY